MKEKTKDLIFNPGICEYNRSILLRFFELGFCTNSRKESCIVTICEFLIKKSDLPFNQWDNILVDAFFANRPWQAGYFDLMKNVLSKLLELSGCETNIKDRTYIEELTKQNNYIYDFTMLQKYLMGTLYTKEMEITKGEKLLTIYSNAIVAVYLSWIGFESAEIAGLCKNNVDLQTKTIRYSDKLISLNDCSPFYNYLKYFIPATTQVVLRNNTIQQWSLIESDSLLKQSKAGSKVGIENLSNKVKSVTGINLRKFHRDGVLNRLYLYEINGGIIDRKHAAAISEVLYISLSSGVHGGKDSYFNLKQEYDIYKLKRDSYRRSI